MQECVMRYIRDVNKRSHQITRLTDEWSLFLLSVALLSSPDLLMCAAEPPVGGWGGAIVPSPVGLLIAAAAVTVSGRRICGQQYFVVSVFHREQLRGKKRESGFLLWGVGWAGVWRGGGAKSGSDA